MRSGNLIGPAPCIGAVGAAHWGARVARLGRPGRPGMTQEETANEEEGGRSTARPGGRLRRRPGGRRRVVKVLLSPEEEGWIVPKAAAAGLSVQRLLVESTMVEAPSSVLVRRTLFQELLAARRDLHGAAVNLNQIARLGNERRQVPLGVVEVLARLEGAQERLAQVAGVVASRLAESQEQAAG